MNREQKRTYTKNMKKKGYSKEAIDFLIKYKETEQKTRNSFNGGDIVKLNYEQITSHPDYIKNKESNELYVVKFHEFVESNKDNELTIEYEDRFKDDKRFVCFKEDQNNPKLLFHYIDLIKVGDENSG